MISVISSRAFIDFDDFGLDFCDFGDFASGVVFTEKRFFFEMSRKAKNVSTTYSDAQRSVSSLRVRNKGVEV